MPDGLTSGGSRPIMLTTDAVGGVWRYTLDLAQGLARRGIPTRVAVLGPSPSPAQRAEADASHVALLETGLTLDWTADSEAALADAIAGLRMYAARHAAAAVHLHAPALAGTQRWAVPVVAVSHSCVATWWHAVRGGPLPHDLRWREAATSQGLSTANAVIAPSRAHADAVRTVYGEVAVQVVHNGASPTPHISLRDRQSAVLTAGRLWDEGKNAAALNRAAPLLDAPIRAAGPVVGPNGASIALERLDLLGTLCPAAMAHAYAGATVFASMARYEPFGLSVLEAARSGMRLVLSDIPSFRELWDGAATFVADEAALAPALQDALALHDDGGARNRAARYTLDAMVDGTLAVHRLVGAPV